MSRRDSCPRCGQPKDSLSANCQACRYQLMRERRATMMPTGYDACRLCGRAKAQRARFCRDCRLRNIEATGFWDRVDASGGLFACWDWLGPVERWGYGKSALLGEWRAHRVAYVALRGPIPEGLTLDHLCRNTLCVNPAHLEPVTNSENVSRENRARHAARRQAAAA
jgi:hypothetical protein